MTIAVGVDGCRAGWIAAIAKGGKRGKGGVESVVLRLVEVLAEFVAELEQLDSRPIVAIDVPIGLPERVDFRVCDREARSRLGVRAPCVFQAADRELLGWNTFAEVQRVVEGRRMAGEDARGLSQQGWRITPKIAEVDALMRAAPSRVARIVEVHPEVSFRELAGADLIGKRKTDGKLARRNLLEPELRGIGEAIESTRWPRSQVGVDDMLDAGAALWSALRYRAGSAQLLGEGRDRVGLPMRMVV